jgi:hypothetical protein
VLDHLAQQVERLRGPPGLELEAVPTAGALQLYLNRARLLIERPPVGTDRVRGDEEDRVRRHQRPQPPMRRQYG